MEKGIRGREILLRDGALRTYVRKYTGNDRRRASPSAAHSRSAYTRWILTCDIHVHGGPSLSLPRLSCSSRRARVWPRRYETGHSYVRRLTNVKKTSRTRAVPEERKGERFRGSRSLARERKRERERERERCRGLISIDGSALLSIAIIRLRIRNAKP